MDKLLYKIVIEICMACSIIASSSLYKGEQRLDADKKQEIEAYMDDFVSMCMSEASAGEQRIFVKTGDIDTGDFDSPVALTVYTNEEGQDIRYTLQIYGETGNSVTDYYVCENFVYVNHEREYYSGQVLMENYNDINVLYRHTSDWMILGDKVYKIQDNEEMQEELQYPFFSMKEVRGWAEEIE